MCEGIARVGNGTCMMVGEQETTFTGKIARLLKAARTPAILDIRIDWGRPSAAVVAEPKVPETETDDEFEMVDDVAEKLKKKLNIFDEDAKDDLNTPPPPPPPVVLPPPAAVQQAPSRSETSSPASAQCICYIAGQDHPEDSHPPRIHRRRRRNRAAHPRHHQPPPERARRPARDPRTCGAQNHPGPRGRAARARADAVEPRRHGPPRAHGQGEHRAAGQDVLRLVDAHVLRRRRRGAAGCCPPGVLGCSACESTRGAALHAPHAMAPPSVHALYSLPPQPHVALGMHMMSSASNTSYASAPGGSPSYGGGWNAPVGSAPPTIAAYAPPTIAAYAPPPRQQQSTQFLFGAAPAAALSDLDGDQFSGLSPSMSFGGATDPVTSGGAAAPIMFGGATTAITNDQYMQSQLERKKERKMATGNKPHRPQMTATDIADPLEALARLQSFDGCFSLDVLNVIKLNTALEHVRGAFPAGATDAVVATVIGLAFLSTKLGATVDRDSWEGMYEKAQQYVEAALRDLGSTETVDVLETKIAKMLA
ncbi:hypothetical protein B0H10DRAFT_1095973 [Mycena sp. CBHHK59/15]|nr:hypothetical protein B0H10DRAFT_1095973 [Mycena sp. CBHHK59/15]